MSLNAVSFSGLNLQTNPVIANNKAKEVSSLHKGINRNGNLYSLSFSGNPNHILLISAECKPFAKAGGMGDVNCEFPGVYNKENSGNKGKDEIRAMIPLYNAEGGPVSKDGKLYFRHSSGEEYPIEKTHIETDFTYGTSQSKAVLYKAENPQNGVKTYFVYSPIISKDKKEYTAPYSNMYRTYTAFSAACTSLLKGLKEKENFDVGVLHTTDWHTAFAIKDLHEKQKKDSFYDGIKTVHTFHNAGYIYQGAVEPLRAALVNFSHEDISKVLKDNRIQDELKKLKIEKSLSGIKEFLHEKEMHPNDYKDPESIQSLNKINFRIRKICKDKPWDKYGNYNPSREAIKESDLITTVSRGFMSEMMSNNKIAPAIRADLYKNKAKTVGIVNGLVAGSFAPQNAKFPFDISNYDTEKIKNKLYVQEDLSLNGKKEILGNINKKHVEGHLDVNPDAMLCVMGSRFDIGQKGFDILMKSSEKFLKENENIQLVIGGSGFPEDSKLIKNFRKNVIEKYPGRVVLVTSFLPNPKLFPAADAILAPSKYEPCGLVQLQAMISGTIPILSNTGGHIDTVISPEENPEKATGFKTSKSFYDLENPEEEFAKIVGQAYKTFTSDKSEWDKMMKNGFKYDSSWNKSVESYYKDVYHNPKIDKRKTETGKNLALSA